MSMVVLHYTSLAGLPSQGGTAITTDLSQNDRAVHIDFFDSTSYMYMD